MKQLPLPFPPRPRDPTRLWGAFTASGQSLAAYLQTREEAERVAYVLLPTTQYKGLIVSTMDDPQGRHRWARRIN